MKEWTDESLWVKAVAYIKRAFLEDRRSDFFPFLASLGLEFAARAAVAKVHPALLADPQDGTNILYAFGYPATSRPTSIPAKTVFTRLKYIIEGFTDQDVNFCANFSDLRNKEIHTGEFAFSSLTTGKWISSYYRVLNKLVEHLGYSLEDVLDKGEAAIAREKIESAEEEIRNEVKKKVGQLQARIGFLSADELAARRKTAEPVFLFARTSGGKGIFRKKCPCCGSLGTLSCDKIGTYPPKLVDGEIVDHDIYWPTAFDCRVCGLALSGNAELNVVDLGDQMIDENTYDPVDFFEIDPSDYITDEMLQEQMMDHDYGND